LVTWRASTLIAGAVTLAIGAPFTVAAIAQDRQSPESLLPPGFGDPAPVATPGGAPVPAATPRPTVQPLPGVDPGALPTPLPEATPTATPTPVEPRYEMPAFARRSLAQVGTADVFPAAAFGSADGRYVETLMRRLSAPLPSRWLSITLRRALAARVDTPARVNGADFAAERAWLLLRMGESVAARAVAQGVDIENVTPKLRQVWMQTALATGDPAGLCPLADGAGNSERGWVVARAMCAALTGTPGAAALMAGVRRGRVAGGVDLQLAQKVMGAGLNSRQAVTIEWAPVTELTTWRFGLAIATGVAVPDELYDTVGPQVAAWRALAPAVPLAERAPAAERAATFGVLSNAALVDLYSALGDGDETPAALAGTVNDLRDAYAAPDRAARLAAMGRLWDAPAGPAGYARLVLTARAAARLPVAAGTPRDDRLVAAMLAAGLDRAAMRWRGRVADGGDAWAMLTLADPDAVAQLSAGAAGGYAPAGTNAARKRQLFLAGLAGLGRLSAADAQRLATSLEVPLGAEDNWTRALDRAVRADQPGTVVLLAAIGMQTAGWAGVPPAALYRIVAALRAVGLEGEARMIAAEAIARI
jgi:hypothetical protein